jgi:hypothetical protein
LYGVANLSDTSQVSQNVTATIRYHAVEQATAWLQGNVGIGGLGGDVDHYWSSLAVRSLVVMPLMSFTNPKTAEYLKRQTVLSTLDSNVLGLWIFCYGFSYHFMVWVLFAVHFFACCCAEELSIS